MSYELRPSSSRHTEWPLFLAGPGNMPSPLAVRSTGEVVLPVPPPLSTAAAAAALEETREAVSVVWPERKETDMLIVLLQGDPDDVGREFSMREGGMNNSSLHSLFSQKYLNRLLGCVLSNVVNFNSRAHKFKA